MQRPRYSRSLKRLVDAENEPLVLTPYIEKGDTLEAISKASSPSLIGSIASYAGFLTVNKEFDSNLFFWFFESQQNPMADPTIVHLRDGLAVSVMKSVFEDSGPYMADENGLRERTNSWIRTFNVLYIDSLIGVGYSFTTQKKGYSSTDNEVAENLYSALTQFLEMFHTFRSNPLYLSGESYATRYAVRLALLISERRERLPVTVNLKGLLLGCPFIDPINQLKYADFLKSHRLLSNRKYESMLRRESAAARAIASNHLKRAYFHVGLMYAKCRGIGYRKLWDVRDPTYNEGGSNHWFKQVQSDEIRRVLHVGGQQFGNRAKAVMNIKRDILHSLIEFLPKLLDRYKVCIYGGQFDMLVVYDNVHDILSNISWSQCPKFGEHEFQEWYVDETLVGYRRSVGNLDEVMILNANHLIVNSQPKTVYELLRKFTSQ